MDHLIGNKANEDSANENPKRQRCTKRVISVTSSTEDNIEGTSNSDDGSSQELLYTTIVSRLWNMRASKTIDGDYQTKTNAEVVDSNENSSDIFSFANEKLQSLGNAKRRRSSRLCCKNDNLLTDSDQSTRENNRDEILLLQDEPVSPPEPSYQNPNQPATRKLKKSVKTAIKKLQMMQKSIEKSRTCIDKDVVNIDIDDNASKIDDSVQIIEPVSSRHSATSSQQKTTIKICCLKSGLHKYDILSSTNFSEVTKYISDIEKVSSDCITLYLNDRRIQEYETPQSIGLTVADILECYIRSTSSTDTQARNEMTLNSIALKNSIQLLINFDTKSKVTLSIGKDEHMGKLMQEFCRHQRVSLSQVMFKLDGETINPLSTPNSLDLETGYCIEAVMLTSID